MVTQENGRLDAPKTQDVHHGTAVGHRRLFTARQMDLVSNRRTRDPSGYSDGTGCPDTGTGHHRQGWCGPSPCGRCAIMTGLPLSARFDLRRRTHASAWTRGRIAHGRPAAGTE
ncbi:hypothetical protein GCM10009779_28950 [Polymorphospora rubra]|uniref:Uncharacterized protein n=1 Tax=Polymorphospora rubra TaxID=338584 RepID=A0A810N6L9_9ACTN|nr:hypothetical protein Prubr_44390 [Polymorphospora rubra]